MPPGTPKRIRAGTRVEVRLASEALSGELLAYFDHPLFGLLADVAIDGHPPGTFRRYVADRVRRAKAQPRPNGRGRRSGGSSGPESNASRKEAQL